MYRNQPPDGDQDLLCLLQVSSPSIHLHGDVMEDTPTLLYSPCCGETCVVCAWQCCQTGAVRCARPKHCWTFTSEQRTQIKLTARLHVNLWIYLKACFTSECILTSLRDLLSSEQVLGPGERTCPMGKTQMLHRREYRQLK